MTFDEIVNEELSADMDAIKAQIKQLQANATDKDKIIGEKNTAIKALQDRLAQMSAGTAKKQEPKIGIGTRRTIQKPAQAPISPIKKV
jgi:hypothetical protein